MLKKFLVIMLVGIGLIFVGCDKDDDGIGDPNASIPGDPVNVTQPTATKNNVQPTATFTVQGERIKLNIQGLIDPTTQQPITLYYNSENPSSSNIFIQQNGVPKGLLVSKAGPGTTLKADIVFTVDNSESMSEEADVIKSSIISFANTLSERGLDVKFGFVSYDKSINGAVNITSVSDLLSHINSIRNSETNGKYKFSGNDANTLQTNASNYASAGGENGVQACLFANQYFTWRTGASKVFINFTDEPTQPNAEDLSFNTAELANKLGGIATVHTVFSEDPSYDYNYWGKYREKPWAMSEATGGTVKFVDGSAANLVLTDLPVVSTLSNSYSVEYMKGSSTVQEWLVTITVYTPTADGSTTYSVTY